MTGAELAEFITAHPLEVTLAAVAVNMIGIALLLSYVGRRRDK